MIVGFGLLNQAQSRTGVELFEARVGARLVAGSSPWRWRVYTRGVLPPEWRGVTGFEEVVCEPRQRIRGGRLWSEQFSWARELARRPVDLLACPGFYPPRDYRRPFVMTIHDLSVLERPQDYPLVVRSYVGAMLRSVVPRALRLSTPSEWVRGRCAELLDFPPDRIDVVYTGVEPKFFAASETSADAGELAFPADPFWLSCGTLQPRKNLEVVVRALALLRGRREAPPRLVCVGGAGRHGARLAALARDLGVADRLEIAGRVDDHALAALYRTCAAFVYPSWLEGFGVPPLEAMAAGARVVAARATCLPEILGDTPVWADPADPQSWCDAWAGLRAESAAERDALRRRARAWAGRYTWDDTALRWRGSLERAAAALGLVQSTATSNCWSAGEAAAGTASGDMPGGAGAAERVTPSTAVPRSVRVRETALVLTPRMPWPLDDGGRIGLWQTVWSAARERPTVLVSLVPPGTENDALPEPLMQPGLEVIRVAHRPPPAALAVLAGAFGRWPYTLARYRSRRMDQVVRALVASRRPAFAFVNHLHLATYVDALGSVPMVLREHNVEHTWMERYAASLPPGPHRAYASLQARRLRSAEAALCSRAALVLAVQELEAATLRALCPGTPVETLPVGVDLGRFREPCRDEPPMILCVGSFSWAPNVEGTLRFLAEGWPRVAAAYPSARLRIAGKAPPAELAAAARAAGAELAGYVPEMEAEFARASALVVPLWVGAGARVKIVEALAARLPVVSTAIGAEGLGLEPGTHYVQGETPADLAVGLLALLRAPDRRAAIERAGRALAERTWSMETVAAQQNAWCARAALRARSLTSI